jgi:hypothetical protein
MLARERFSSSVTTNFFFSVTLNKSLLFSIVCAENAHIFSTHTCTFIRCFISTLTDRARRFYYRLVVKTEFCVRDFGQTNEQQRLFNLRVANQ